MPKKKQRGMIERTFASAGRWLATRYGDYGFTEGDEKHVSYRCGWVAGCRAAVRDGKGKESSHE